MNVITIINFQLIVYKKLDSCVRANKIWNEISNWQTFHF
jgi:hypothetical protein